MRASRLEGPPDRLVFCYPDGSPFGRNVARRPIGRGVPLVTVAKLLGQSVLTVTARYAHLGPE